LQKCRLRKIREENFTKFWAQKKASYPHRTATTVYPCCVPTLGDSTGASRVGLAGCKCTMFNDYNKCFYNFFTAILSDTFSLL